MPLLGLDGPPNSEVEARDHVLCGKERELYDLHKDAGQMTNVAGEMA
jgi:hypothetical protein